MLNYTLFWTFDNDGHNVSSHKLRSMKQLLKLQSKLEMECAAVKVECSNGDSWGTLPGDNPYGSYQSQCESGELKQWEDNLIS